jgi:hypothetical protein
MKNLLLETLLTLGITGFCLWRWTVLLPRVVAAIQPVANLVLQRRRETEEAIQLIDTPVR